MPTAQGKTFSLADFKGDVVLVVFWAPWCVSCREELTAIETLRKKHLGEGFSVVAICVDTPTDMAKKFLHEFPMSFPVLMDRRGAVADSFGVKGIPASFLLDGDAVVRHRYAGSTIREKDVSELLQQLKTNK